jgi:hypothetical protein
VDRRGAARPVISIATLALTARLFLDIDRHAVDVLFYDQWDFFDPLFRGDGVAALFLHQHGVHREGLGLPLMKVLADGTAWNMRAPAFAVGVLLVVATLLALALTRIVTRTWSVWDVIVPLACLTPSQWAVYAEVAEPAYVVLPLALSLALALAWYLPSRTRGPAVTVLGLLLLFTGRGVLMTPIVLLLLAVDGVRRRSLVSCAGIVAVLGGVAVYASGYTWFGEPPCLRLAVPFALAVLGRFFGLRIAWGDGLWPYIFGGAALAAGVAVLVNRGRTLLRRDEPADFAVFGLGAFGVAWVLLAGMARSCGGIEGSQASRYATLVIPLVLAVYLHVRTELDVRWRPLGVTALAVALVLPLGLGRDAPDERDLAAQKRAWVACYLEREDVAACDARGGAVHPEPERTRLDEKLRFLRERRLSFYRR